MGQLNSTCTSPTGCHAAVHLLVDDFLRKVVRVFAQVLQKRHAHRFVRRVVQLDDGGRHQGVAAHKWTYGLGCRV
jgi:hypothetical protein